LVNPLAIANRCYLRSLHYFARFKAGMRAFSMPTCPEIESRYGRFASFFLSSPIYLLSLSGLTGPSLEVEEESEALLDPVREYLWRKIIAGNALVDLSEGGVGVDRRGKGR